MILESEIEEIEVDRGDPQRLMAADERLVTRMRRRLWTQRLTAELDPETFRTALAPSAAAAPLFERFRIVPDPTSAGAIVAISAHPELQAGDEITALVFDSGVPIPVRSLGEVATSARVNSATVSLVVRRAGRTLVVGELAR